MSDMLLIVIGILAFWVGFRLIRYELNIRKH
jgi:hypothetical protein